MRFPIIMVTTSLSALLAGDAEQRFAPVAGWTAPAAGEHPRLFFRKADIPAIRKRAETPEGKAMVAQLKMSLGGGEAMPTVIPKATAAYQGVDKDLPTGAYTIFHAAGFGMLYQLTGDKKYAELGKQCTEMAINGTRDRDDRYAFVNPGGFLRAGPSVGAIAMGYDLCYDGWDEAFRTKVAGLLINYDGGRTNRDGGGQQTMERLAVSPQMGPHSNHWGCQVGGAGLAMLAIKGDPGVDAAKNDKYLEGVHKNFVRAIAEGHGTRGYFNEHHGPGQINTDTAMTAFVLAAKNAWGRDYTAWEDVRWIGLQWAQLLSPPGADGKPFYPAPVDQEGYGGIYFERHGLSRGGQFVQGFPLLKADERSALLWTWNHVIAPNETKTYPKMLASGNTVSYDIMQYPYRAAIALATWPMGEKEADPGTILPRATYDARKGYFVFRKQWKDENDIIISFLTNARNDGPNDVNIWALGQRIVFGYVDRGLPDYWLAAADGSAVLGLGKRTHVAVDFSPASGADAVMIRAVAGGDFVKRAGNRPAIGKPAASGGKVQVTTLTLGTLKAEVLTLSASGKHPTAEVKGDAIVVGGQSFTFADGKLAIKVIGATRTTP